MLAAEPMAEIAQQIVVHGTRHRAAARRGRSAGNSGRRGVDIVVLEKVVAGRTMSAIAAVSVRTARAPDKQIIAREALMDAAESGETTIGLVFWIQQRRHRRAVAEVALSPARIGRCAIGQDAGRGIDNVQPSSNAGSAGTSGGSSNCAPPPSYCHAPVTEAGRSPRTSAPRRCGSAKKPYPRRMKLRFVFRRAGPKGDRSPPRRAR